MVSAAVQHDIFRTDVASQVARWPMSHLVIAGRLLHDRRLRRDSASLPHPTANAPTAIYRSPQLRAAREPGHSVVHAFDVVCRPSIRVACNHPCCIVEAARGDALDPGRKRRRKCTSDTDHGRCYLQQTPRGSRRGRWYRARASEEKEACRSHSCWRPRIVRREMVTS